ncbi:hypothetical protein ISD63_01005 [Pseudomonas aeruginosa]|nr:hypothetical protein [Pseudomonas aeruginosa]
MSNELNKAPVEQAGGDERAAFEAWLAQALSKKFVPEFDLAKYEDSGEYRYSPAAAYWKAWQARAALAQPSPKCVKCGGTGEADSGGVHPWGEPVLIPCDCETEQAEAERPEVVASVVHSNPVVLDHCGPLNANDELMTVAQHAASVARWAEMFNRVEQERDAALARVAELELKLDQSDYAYDNDRHHMRGMAKQAAEAIQVFTGHDSGANLAHRYGEKWWEYLDELRDALLAFAKSAPPAQAQHSVPEGWMIVECGIWTQEQVDEMQKTVARFRSSEFVDDRTLAMAVADAGQCKAPEISLAELLAAAPGKSVPQAWLDVLAERRRQITAEGWTPEHDDLYCAAELPRAAAAYILSGANDEAPAIWPFLAKWWKPRDARANYVRAGALILAEIERLDRAGAPGKEGV